MAELTEKQKREEERLMKGVPRFNIGAFLLPPVWGPAHGIWATILFYPIWLVADNVFYAAFAERTPIAIVVAVLVLAALVALTVAFAILSQPYAMHRAIERGLSREEYLRRQRYWAIGCAIGGAALIVFATIYNLNIRPFIELA